jgi:hypothetical protein
MRSAHNPWGPWSEPVVVFDPWKDGGYCNFIHRSWQSMNCDSAYDPGRENVWGGEYGAYVVERFTKNVGNDVNLFFIMSTWNPYNTVLMETTLHPPTAP